MAPANSINSAHPLQTIWLETIWHDTRYALRTLRKQPAFTATAVFTLALAIGGNTAMFTVIHAVLLKPLPYPDPDRLVSLSGGATPTRFLDMKAHAHSFAGIAAFTGPESPTFSGAAEPEVLKAARVSSNFLQVLKMDPVLGRSFREEEDSPGGPPVVMISTALWQRRFASDPAVLGKTATVAGTPHTIIGVLPPRFSFPFADLDLWMTQPVESPLMPAKSRALSPFLALFGRLKPQVSLAQANAEAKVIRRQYAIDHPTMLDSKPKPPELTAMKDSLVADVRSMLWMLLGAVGFVLLTACANMASLLLARATARSRETAVRSALGAARIRLIAQLVVESLVLSLAGGVLAMFIAAWSLRAIPGITAFELPRTQEIHLDWTVLAFAATLSIATAILFSLAPALAASRPDLIRLLRMSGATGHQTAPGGLLASISVRGLLLVLQVSLSIVLLIGTALLIESVSRLRGVTLGFNPANILTARVSLAPSRYDTNAKRALFFEQLIQQVRSSPGVRSAAAAMTLPMMESAGTPVQDAAKPLLNLNERLIASLSVITPGYLRTLAIPLRRGRDFNVRDKEETQRVAIIDENLARRFWPSYPQGQDPIGQHIWVGGIHPRPAQIVGIAANIRQSLENVAWPETVYVPFAQAPQLFALVAIRTNSNPLDFNSALRQQVQRLDKDESISQVESMDSLVDDQIGQRRLLVTLLGSFAGMALLLVLMGLYGIIAYSVAERTQEIGIRRALGAQRSDVLRLIGAQTLRLALAGVVIGTAGALALTRLLENLLFHVSPTDPATFVVVVSLFLCVALAASCIPALRATRIDPVTALRI